MKPERMIEEIAKMDGFERAQITHYGCFGCWRIGDTIGVKLGASGYSKCPDYLTSRDAVIPLVEKWCIENNWDTFFYWFCKVTSTDSEGRSVHIMKWTLMATAEQLCEALLRAANKWEDA